MKKQFLARIIIVAVVALVITGGMLAISNSWLLAAEPRPKAVEVPNSTLIVGTHLIALSAITDEIAKVAEDSANTGSQNKVYYKSEIDSTWYDITNTEKVLSKPVTNTEIDNLITNTLTHWTKADGKTYDLATGEVVKIHELRDLAKPLTVTEADPLSTLKQVQENLAKNEKDETAKARLDFAVLVLNDLVQEINATVASSAYSALKAAFSGINDNSYDTYRMAMIIDGGGGTAEVMLAFNISETDAAMRIATYNAAKSAASSSSEEEEEEDAKELAEKARKAQAELRNYYRILAKEAEVNIAGAADLPTKVKDINAYDDFIIYLRAQKEPDSVVELAVAEKAQLQAVYDMACVMVMIERLNAGLSLAKALPAEDVASVLTDVLNAYQAMLGDLEAIVRGEPTTVLLEIYQAKAESMTASVRGGSYPGARGTLLSLACVQHCLDNVLVDNSGELAVLNEAIPKSLTKINDYFKAGENRVYEKNLNGDEVKTYALAKTDKSPQAALEGIKNSGISANKMLLDEYTMLLDLYKKRGELEAHTALIRSGISTFEALAKTLPQDDFRIENYKLLMDLVNKLYAMLGENTRLMDDDYQQQLAEQQALQEELNRLNNDYLDAMLNGDFERADELMALMEALMSDGANYTSDSLQEYMDLSTRLGLIDELLENASDEERDALLAEKYALQAAIDALKEQDALIAAVDGAGGPSALPGALGGGGDGLGGDLSSLIMALVEQYNLDLDPDVLADLQLAQNLPEDGLLRAMMQAVLERLLLLDALDSGLLDAAGQATAQDLLDRSLTTIVNNELNKYNLDEMVDFYKRSLQFGAIGHETAALHNSSIIIGYTQKCLNAPVLMFRGQPYVPIHDTMAYFGGQTVHLKERDRVVVQAPGGLYVEFTAGESQAYVNDILTEMPGPVLDFNFVLYAPASFIADMMGIPWEFVTEETPYGDEPVFIFYYFEETPLTN